MRKRISDSSDPAKADLPDYSADWQLPGPKASNAEIVARFYYEFARESQTILMLTERLCHFSRGEILRAQLQALNYPGSPLEVLHPMCAGIMYALTPAINLREVSWNQLEPEQKRILTNESALGGDFRQLDFRELFNFAHELIYPTERKSTTPEYENIRPRWYRSSRLYYGGIEEVPAAVLSLWTSFVPSAFPTIPVPRTAIFMCGFLYLRLVSNYLDWSIRFSRLRWASSTAS